MKTTAGREIYMPPMEREPLWERIKFAFKLMRAKHAEGWYIWL